MATILRRLDGTPPVGSKFTLYHDAENVVLTTHSQTLTIAESSHVLTDAGCDIYISNLLVDSCYNDHVANHIYALGHDVNLTVQEAYHLHFGDATYASLIAFIGTDPLNPPRLPDLRSDGRSGERGATIDPLLLPGLSLDSRVGSRMVADLPDLGIAASATQNTPITVDAVLPSMSVSSRAGIRCGTMRLPAMEILASTDAVHLCTLDRQLPGITVSASGLETNLSTLVADLPALQATITIDAEIWASLDTTIPPPTLSATASGQLTMNMSGLLPTLRVVSGIENTSLTVEGYIPPLIMASAGEGVGGAVLEDTTRYDGLVLRYAR
jgi:hypothetical protein